MTNIPNDADDLSWRCFFEVWTGALADQDLMIERIFVGPELSYHRRIDDDDWW